MHTNLARVLVELLLAYNCGLVLVHDGQTFVEEVQEIQLLPSGENKPGNISQRVALVEALANRTLSVELLHKCAYVPIIAAATQPEEIERLLQLEGLSAWSQIILVDPSNSLDCSRMSRQLSARAHHLLTDIDTHPVFLCREREADSRKLGQLRLMSRRRAKYLNQTQTTIDYPSDLDSLASGAMYRYVLRSISEMAKIINLPKGCSESCRRTCELGTIDWPLREPPLIEYDEHRTIPVLNKKQCGYYSHQDYAYASSLKQQWQLAGVTISDCSQLWPAEAGLLHCRLDWLSSSSSSNEPTFYKGLPVLAASLFALFAWTICFTKDQVRYDAALDGLLSTAILLAIHAERLVQTLRPSHLVRLARELELSISSELEIACPPRNQQTTTNNKQ